VTVVSDTSPICYLLLIGQIELLEALFQRVYIPSAVQDELAHPDAPAILRDWMASPPAWLEVRSAPAEEMSLSRLHAGEREAILLAHELRAEVVLLDDRRARLAARESGLEVMGLLGVLSQAAKKGLVSLVDALDRLQRTSFRVNPRLLKAKLEAESPPA
jgi:predicted nucleic acid-binding protein